MIRRKKEGIELNENEYSDMCVDLKADSSLDIEEILQIEKSEFNSYFVDKSGFNDKNIELIADLMITMAEITFVDNIKLNLYQCALDIYHLLDESSKTFSIERIEKINDVKNIINSIN